MFAHLDEDCPGLWTQRTRLGWLSWTCPDCGATSPNSDDPFSASFAVRAGIEHVRGMLTRMTRRIQSRQLPA